jgi:hypothetical protein
MADQVWQVSMGSKHSKNILPRYRGQEWTGTKLPVEAQDWLIGKGRSVSKDKYHRAAYEKEIEKVVGKEPWEWPKHPHYFISDMHGDAEAFIASLVASGAVTKTGPADSDIKLTKEGHKGRFLIGGDCFDKGPSTLRLLRAIQGFVEKHDDTIILAGNHDIRMMLGIRSIHMEPDPRTDHFFIRMGRKMVPFLKEISEQYLQGKNALKNIPTSRECRRILYPPKSWFKEFPLHAVWSMPETTIQRELKKMHEKIHQFDEACEEEDLSIRMVYAAAEKWYELFLKSKGEFSWFYRHMRLCYRKGSFLFLHAGIDDRIAEMLDHSKCKHVNKKFRELMYENPYDFYYGPVANSIRTKYRNIDRPLTHKGVKLIRKHGIHVLVHGHRNLLHGQRLMLRKGLLNVECDTTMDRNSRKREGLDGVGAAATIIRPEGYILGVSNDYPYIKQFDLTQTRR